ncbi:endonuclease/exonuclease/phosphatase family protein [Nocardioides sp.]|uniref:endonuclease/exonuclease/phosphatase family protein n=1 Tax=Nocardioides sp. TaxID=35761 RepID=UPI00378508FA
MRVGAVVFWVAVAVLLVPALGVTFARAVEPQRSFWLLVEGFTPVGVVLYGLVVLLLAVRLVVVRRWWTWALAAVALAGLLVHCWWFAPQVSGANPPPAAGAEPMVVMTSNIAHGAGDATALVRLAESERADVLVVEEITAADLAEMDAAGLADLLPHRVGTPEPDSDGTMVFALERLGPAEALATTHGGWVVALGDLTLVATHPQAPTVPEDWRADHAVLLATVEADHPDLVVGDLNATSDHAPMRALADAGYRDVGELADQGWQPTWPAQGSWSLGLPTPPLAQIDHVLVGPRLAAIGMHTVDVPGSDHRAVVALVARK